MLTLFMLPVSAVSIQPEEAFTDVSGEEYYAYAAAALKHHSVLSGYADGSFGAERSIARAEMAAIVCRMKLDDDSISRYQGQTLFRDVAGSHWASGYINYASNEGIVNGKGSGIFAPEAQVTLEEAVKMVVCALGWESQAQQQGGWPDGYYTVARNAGLLENVQGLKWQAATRGDIAVLVHAAMSQEVPMPAYQDYVIFVAEVASTCNEALLMEYLLSVTEDKKQRAYLINHFLEQFRGTLYRQTMFAEFELKVNEMTQRGEGTTAEALCALYKQLNEQYFGPDMVVDDEIALEWARIPHFYYDYYVYQYATGYAAAIALSRRILREGEAAVRDYLRFLSGGCSADPVTLLRGAGVDMAGPAPVEDATRLFDELIGEMEALLA